MRIFRLLCLSLLACLVLGADRAAKVGRWTSEFNVRGDGVTDDTAGMQACLTYSYTHGVPCLMRGENVVVSKTLEMAPREAGFQFMAKLRGYATANDYPGGSTITYTGTGTALRAQVGAPQKVSGWRGKTVYSVGDFVHNGQQDYECVVAGKSAESGGPNGTGTDITDGMVHWAYSQAGPGGACTNADCPLNGEISNVEIRYVKPAPTNGRAIDICNANNLYMNNVTIQSSATGDLGAGVRCRGCAISWFDKVIVVGWPIAPGAFVRDAILLSGNPGFGAGGGLWFRGTYIFFARRAVHFVGTTGATWFSPSLGFDDFHFDAVGTGFYFDNTIGPMVLDNVHISGGRQTHESLGIDADSAAVAIDETGPNPLQLQLVYEKNEHSCFGGCSVTHNIAKGTALSRRSNIVTATVTEPCIRFRTGNKVYKTGALDASFPGGMKTITGMTSDKGGACSEFDSFVHPDCAALTAASLTPCKRFTYAEKLPDAASSSAASVFDAGDYPFTIFSSSAGQSSSSMLDLTVRDNPFSGWSRGGWRFYSMDAQTPCTPPNCNAATLNWTHNRVIDNTNPTPLPAPRNTNSVWGAGSGADGYSLPELATNLREGHISIVPPNTVAVSNGINGTAALKLPGDGVLAYPNVIHSLYHARIVLDGSRPSRAALRVPDYQDYCTCLDLTTGATYVPAACTRDNNTFTNSNIPNIQGSCAVKGPNGSSNVIECRCW